ncbi:MAG: hypothetical protein ACXWZR_14235 [Mycobacterium sp.]
MPLADGQEIAVYTVVRSLGCHATTRSRFSRRPSVSQSHSHPGHNDQVLPSESQQPVLVCMEQTGQSHIDCHSDILEVNRSG